MGTFTNARFESWDNPNIGIYIILDDITATGSSLGAAKQLLINNGVPANKIIKMAVEKTTHDNEFFISADALYT